MSLELFGVTVSDEAEGASIGAVVGAIAFPLVWTSRRILAAVLGGLVAGPLVGAGVGYLIARSGQRKSDHPGLDKSHDKPDKAVQADKPVQQPTVASSANISALASAAAAFAAKETAKKKDEPMQPLNLTMMP